MQAEWFAQIVAKRAKYQGFHLADLFRGVSIVGDEYEVPNLRSVHLLVFAGQEHGTDAHQLQFLLAHRANLRREV